MRDRRKRASWIAATAAIACVLLMPPMASGGWPSPGDKVAKTRDGGPEILFTFDDGPDHEQTEVVLDSLAEHNIQAIFYTVGYRLSRRGRNLRERKATFERIIREGHLIGNHTVNHAHLCRVSAEKAAAEIDEAHATLEEYAGYGVFMFRAPYGDKCDRLEQMLAERGLRHDHWDLDPREWLHKSSSATKAYVTGKLRRLKGRAVLLMHDTKLATVRALPDILEWLDKENKRRAEAGEKTIRVLRASDWVADNWEDDLWRAGRDASKLAAERLRESLLRLLPGATRLASNDPP